jgi:GH25 family lysozyme M1 (1,4-beta-N-acetylmuramidase)
MKRTKANRQFNCGRRGGVVLLAASLLTGLGLSAPAVALEPSATVSPTGPSSAATAAASPTGSATTTPSPTVVATPAATPPATTASPSPPKAADYRSAMAAATASGGAEMGQGLAAGTGASAKKLTTQAAWAPSFGVPGLDVSEYQPSVNWQQQWNMGARFAYIKATEGNYYTNPIFTSQYSGARGAGLIRGAYHFANPAAW